MTYAMFMPEDGMALGNIYGDLRFPKNNTVIV